MRKTIFIFLFFLLFLPGSVLGVDFSYEQLIEDSERYGQEHFMIEEEGYKEVFFQGQVLQVGEEEFYEVFPGYREKKQVIKVRLIDTGEVVEVENTVVEGVEQGRVFEEGERVVLVGYKDEEGVVFYYIHDYNRTGGLVLVTVIFLIVIIYFGRVRGVGALGGLAFSAVVLIYFVIPRIVAGSNPAVVTLIGSVLIASVSLFLSHGINRRTPIIWLSTITTLALAVGLSSFFIDVTNLFGMGSDASLSFQIGDYAHINLRGLLLAGVVISVLGILDDVTATQTATIWELKKSNNKLGFHELYRRGLNVGREHIASLVSTLALVYAGASLPLFIILGGIDYMPLWVKINSEPLAEEIVRTIIGSTALILAVPIASVFAAYFIGKTQIKKGSEE